MYLGSSVSSSAIASTARECPSLLDWSVAAMLAELLACISPWPRWLFLTKRPLAFLVSSSGPAEETFPRADARTDFCGNVTNPADVFRPGRDGIDVGMSGKAETVSEMVVEVDGVPTPC